MREKSKKILLLIIILITIILIIISVITLLMKYKKSKDISNIYEVYSTSTIQNRLENQETNIKEENANYNINTIVEQKNGENTLGVIKINAIGYEGLVYEGTNLETLSKGVGHFENSAYFEGNVCLANHNTISQWSKLNTLKNGDTIIYTSFLGVRKYEVDFIKQIKETDWSRLINTGDNRITLITCVKGKPNLRLCVQALEK